MDQIIGLLTKHGCRVSLAGADFVRSAESVTRAGGDPPSRIGRCLVRPPTSRFRRRPIFTGRAAISKQPIGIFDGQSDIGSAVVPGSATYDAATKQYTINSAGYNIWYSRDEFYFLWKKMSGDVSLAADVTFPDPKGYGDRKAVLVIRQNLEDDAKEAMLGEHGVGMVHLAQRPEKAPTSKTCNTASAVDSRMSGPSASESRNAVTRSRSSSASKASPCSNSVRRSSCTSTSRSMWGSASARIFPTRSIPRSCPMCFSRTPRARCGNHA